jgi:hypothetical protein
VKIEKSRHVAESRPVCMSLIKDIIAHDEHVLVAIVFAKLSSIRNGWVFYNLAAEI